MARDLETQPARTRRVQTSVPPPGADPEKGLLVPTRWRSLAALTCIAVASASAAEQPCGTNPDLCGELRRIVATESRWCGASGMAVAVSVDGRLVFEQASGYANVELRVPMTPSTVVQLSSTSKAFTGVAALIAVDDGLLDLDASARRYLPGLPAAWSAVTVRQLLTHTSGLPEVLECDTPSREQAWQCVTALPVPAAPGQRFRYTQTNYFLILEILERIYGEPFPELMRDQVFAPAGMISASYAGSHRDVVPGRATSYYPNGSGGLQLREFDFPEYLLSAAGLNVSLEDLLRFDSALFGGRLIAPGRLEQLWQEPTLSDGSRSSYGLGWDVKTNADGSRSAGHEGGRLTTFRRFLGERISVVVLANGSSARFDPDRLAALVADVLAPGIAGPSGRLGLQMRRRLLDGDVQGAIAEYRAFIEDPASRDENTENVINRLGYELLDRRSPEDAVAFFQLNVARYPTSANAHDSLGEGLAEAGRVAEAIGHYRRSFELDPTNHNAEEKLQELKQREQSGAATPPATPD